MFSNLSPRLFRLIRVLLGAAASPRFVCLVTTAIGDGVMSVPLAIFNLLNTGTALSLAGTPWYLSGSPYSTNSPVVNALVTNSAQAFSTGLPVMSR